MPVMVIGRGHVCPTTTGESSEEAHAGDHFGQSVVWSCRKNIPKKDQGKPGTGSDGNEHLEDRSLRIPIANRRRNGGEPFFWIAVILVLDNLVEMQAQAHDQCAKECRCCKDRMRPGYPFSIDLEGMVSLD